MDINPVLFAIHVKHNKIMQSDFWTLDVMKSCNKSRALVCDKTTQYIGLMSKNQTNQLNSFAKRAP
jgi:hypothetical protein